LKHRGRRKKERTKKRRKNKEKKEQKKGRRKKGSREKAPERATAKGASERGRRSGEAKAHQRVYFSESEGKLKREERKGEQRGGQCGTNRKRRRRRKKKSPYRKTKKRMCGRTQGGAGRGKERIFETAAERKKTHRPSARPTNNRG
jgi:hypothetical protein